MDTLDRFVAALKNRLRDEVQRGETLWYHDRTQEAPFVYHSDDGDTESGFYDAVTFDFDVLCAEIDKLAATFKKS